MFTVLIITGSRTTVHTQFFKTTIMSYIITFMMKTPVQIFTIYNTYFYRLQSTGGAVSMGTKVYYTLASDILLYYIIYIIVKDPLVK